MIRDILSLIEPTVLAIINRGTAAIFYTTQYHPSLLLLFFVCYSDNAFSHTVFLDSLCLYILKVSVLVW